MFHPIEEALDALKKGEVIIVVDDEDRENEGDFVALASMQLQKSLTLWRHTEEG